MVSVGAVCGVGGITAIPTTGYTNSLTFQQGFGYVGQLGDGTYIRFYVTSMQSGPVIDLQYEYPATICPPSSELVFTGASYTFNGVKSAEGAQNSTGNVHNFAFVGCSGNATVQAWGAGGAGGAPTISFFGGNGGGGGGGAGYGTQIITQVPGQWYVVSTGVGGDTGFNATNPSFGIGGPSGIAVEAGSTIFSSGGGQPGTDAGTGTTVGKGGTEGTSNATTVSDGVPGGDGQTNLNLQLCGGGGAIGPGGPGGAGGGGGGAGGAGGCTPGVASPPGGGGAGGSQLGAETPGASGRVIIDY
jgi:hypothetical protein